MICPLCEKPIEPNTPAIQFAGGFIQLYPDSSGPNPTFVQEPEIMSESFTHKDCLSGLLLHHHLRRKGLEK